MSAEVLGARGAEAWGKLWLLLLDGEGRIPYLRRGGQYEREPSRCL